MRFDTRQSQAGRTLRAVAHACVAVLLFSSVRVSRAADPSPPAPGIFEANMERIFADGRADIRVVFGYDNNEGIVEPNDPARSRQFTNYLLSRSFAPITPTAELAASLGVPVDAANMRAFSGTTEDGRRMRVALI